MVSQSKRVPLVITRGVFKCRESPKMNVNTITNAVQHINQSLQTGDPARAKGALGIHAQRTFSAESMDMLSMAFREARLTSSEVPIQEFWEERTEALAAVLAAVNDAVTLHPSLAVRHMNPISFGVIALKDRTGMWVGMDDAESLLRHLRDNRELRETLDTRGKELAAAKAARKVWAEMPEAFKKVVRDHHNRFLKDLPAEKKMSINGRETKTSLERGLAALDNEGNGWWAVLGAQFTVRALFSQQWWWAKSAMFWEEVAEPVAPWEKRGNDTNPSDPIYDGGELPSYEGPFGTRHVVGLTQMEAHADQCEAIAEVRADFADAAEEADALCDQMVAALESEGVEGIYLYRMEADGSFDAVTDKEVAVSHLMLKDEARAVKKMGTRPLRGQPAVRHATREELQEDILASLSPEERAVVMAALGGGA